MIDLTWNDQYLERQPQAHKIHIQLLIKPIKLITLQTKALFSQDRHSNIIDYHLVGFCSLETLAQLGFWGRSGGNSHSLCDCNTSLSGGTLGLCPSFWKAGLQFRPVNTNMSQLSGLCDTSLRPLAYLRNLEMHFKCIGNVRNSKTESESCY